MTNEFSVSREIEASGERLWEMVSDVTRMGDWSPETTNAVWAGGATGPAVGAKFRGSNRNGKRSWKTACVVVDSEPGRRFAFRSTAGPLSFADWMYEFEETDTGCLVTESWSDRRGWLARSVSGIASGVGDRVSHNKAGMEQTLENLAVAAESSGSDA